MILMETMGEAEFGLPIFLTVMVAKVTGDLFNRPGQVYSVYWSICISLQNSVIIRDIGLVYINAVL